MAALRLLFAILILPLTALADDACYSNNLVIDRTVDWDFSSAEGADFRLPSWNGVSPPFLTAAAVHFSLEGSELSTKFDFKTELLGLPYNVYRVDVIVGDKGEEGYVEHVMDLTGGCRGPGASFYPGGKLSLYPQQIPPLAEGRNRGLQKVRFLVWGVLR